MFHKTVRLRVAVGHSREKVRIIRLPTVEKTSLERIVKPAFFQSGIADYLKTRLIHSEINHRKSRRKTGEDIMDSNLAKQAANTIRLLAADAVQKAKSGHPGMPMGCADAALAIWTRHMRHNPEDPNWAGRDRFLLSAGHGSMLLYSLLHLFEYGLPIEELKQFRQWGSRTPGHPEFGHTAGVEVTTGPLGSGFASGVGMAIAAKYLAARTGFDRSGLADQRFFIMSSDGCMMEGTTHETASIAGHLKLDNIICFYDDNSITIEGETKLAFSEDVGKRFEAYGWRVIRCDDANDFEKIDASLSEACKSDGRPTLIVGKTKIGFGSPNLAGKEESHGAPLGADELLATRKNLGMPEEEFHVSDEVRAMFRARVGELVAAAREWDGKAKAFFEANPEVAKAWHEMTEKVIPANLLEELLRATPVDKATATRVSGGTVLQKAAELVPSLLGGAADLAPSTRTNLKKESSFSAENRAGRNLHFGVRELGMGMCGNGLALSGSVIPYVSTFFVFADYMKPAIRLAAIQNLHEIYVFTHDSFYVGEDGPTHEPIEQIAMLRSIPGMTVIRPAEAVETAHAWDAALQAKGPVAILLTRQDVSPLSPEQAKRVELAKGAYVLDDEIGAELALIATGSEVQLALEAAAILRQNDLKVRVVSMPSWELFEKQDEAYRKSVLPDSCWRRISIEAGSTFGWKRYVGDEGFSIGIDHFGASAPYKVLAEKFGFQADSVARRIMEHYEL
jgi:transketolase